jgi:hypothetical protein
MNSFLDHTDWLYTIIYENQFFFFDYWSIIHFASGLLIFLGLSILKIKRRFATLLFILIIYEIGELIIRETGYEIFRQELRVDQITDIWLGMLGGLVAYLILKLK